MPGSMPATSQLDWLISMTAMIVLFWSRATRDLLKSFGWGIAALHRLHPATKLPFPRRPPHSVSRSPARGTTVFETMFTPCNRSGTRYAANGTSITATERGRLASTFMDNTCWSTPKGLALAGPHQDRDRGRAARAAAGLPDRRRG